MKVDDYKLLSGYTNSENSCLPASVHEVKRNDRAEEFQRFSGNEFSKNVDLPLSGCSIYVDPDISAELRTKVFICSLINFFFLFKILVLACAVVLGSCGQVSFFIDFAACIMAIYDFSALRLMIQMLCMFDRLLRLLPEKVPL